MTPLAGFIEKRARELGFDPVGFAPARPADRAQLLRDWLEAGYHGEMSWMARDPDRRIDPQRYFPPARSIVCVGAHYDRAEPSSLAGDTGRISRYAWGEDYHEVLQKRLFTLADSIRETFPEVQTRVAIDTAAVLEKPIAQQAGLGWIGKNACLIRQGAGSWFFLGEILVGASLPPSSPAVDRCGTCDACQGACPTDAFVSPYVLDSNRCISYLTIEHRGPIDRSLRAAFGNRIFGCDDCQDVCPWNRFSRPSTDPAFRPRPENLAPLLSDLLALTKETFRERFRGTPIRRTGRDRFVRNVAIAAGNSGSSALIGPLILALEDDSALVRGHAAWALGQLGGETARRALDERHEIETDPWVNEEIALATRPSPSSSPSTRGKV